MPDITILKREYYATSLGLTAAQAAIMSITDLEFLFFSNPPTKYGTGSPVGVVSASPGAVWVDSSATFGASIWVKKTGTGNSGWEVASGDTNWRLISSLVPIASGVISAGSYTRIRRTNNLVQLQIEVATDASFVSATTVLTLPAGFAGWPSYPSPGYSGVAWSGASGNLVKLNYSGANAGLRGTWVFTTTDAWPTALPGTAI